MGLFKKNVRPLEKDEDIRREIRARVAKQAGIYDEEYINTGILGGKTTDALIEQPASQLPSPEAEPDSVFELALDPVDRAAPAIESEPENFVHPEARPEPAESEPAESEPAESAPAENEAALMETASALPPEATPAPVERTKEALGAAGDRRRKPPKGRGRLLVLLILIMLMMIPVGYAIVSLEDCTSCTEHVPCVLHCPDCSPDFTCPLHCPDCTRDVPCTLHCPDCLSDGYCAIHNQAPKSELQPMPKRTAKEMKGTSSAASIPEGR